MTLRQALNPHTNYFDLATRLYDTVRDLDGSPGSMLNRTREQYRVMNRSRPRLP